MSKASRAARRATKTTEPEVQSPTNTEVQTTEIASEPKSKKIRYMTRTWGPNDVIRVLKPNAKGPVTKSKSAARYALYRDGMTVAEYTDAVVNASGSAKGSKTLAALDLRWDSSPDRGHIAIEAATAKSA